MDNVKRTVEKGHLAKYMDMLEDFLQDEEFGTLEAASALLKLTLDDGNEKDFVEELERELKIESENRKKGKSKPDKKRKFSGDDKMITLVINAGYTHNLKVNDFVGAIAGETGLPGKVIGAIQMQDYHTFIDVNKKHAKEIIQKMKNKKIKGLKIKLDMHE
jgi:ATP-dependent RNA helicase DeaD